MSTKKGTGHSKGHAHADHGPSDLDKLKKVVGIAFRIGLDIFVSVLVLVLLWKMGIDEKVMSTGFNWTVKAMATGFAHVLVPLWYGDMYGVMKAIFWNIVSWDTFTFVMDTALMTGITFVGYVLWRNWWLGGTMLVLGGLGLAWIVTMWAQQVLGPLLLPIPVGVALIALVIKGMWWAAKKLWSFAEPAPAH